jgi:hypothetical protein
MTSVFFAPGGGGAFLGHLLLEGAHRKLLAERPQGKLLKLLGVAEGQERDLVRVGELFVGNPAGAELLLRGGDRATALWRAVCCWTRESAVI